MWHLHLSCLPLLDLSSQVHTSPCPTNSAEGASHPSPFKYVLRTLIAITSEPPLAARQRGSAAAAARP